MANGLLHCRGGHTPPSSRPGCSGGAAHGRPTVNERAHFMFVIGANHDVGIILSRTDILPVSPPPCRLCANRSDSLEHALLYCTAHHNARQRCLQQSSGYPCSSCLTQTCALTLLMTLPATSRMLHTFAKPLRRAKYDHFLRASACSCTHLLKRVVFFVRVCCMF